MGWTGLHREKGITNEEFFRKEFSRVGDEIVFHAHGTSGNVFYVAWEDTKQNPGAITASVILTSWSHKEYWNFNYKEISESGLPTEAYPPLKVLDALTETDNEYALIWRERARKYHERRALSRNLKPGDRVTLMNKVKFRSGLEQGTFIVARVPARGGRTVVRLSNGINTFLIPNWRDRVKEVERGWAKA
ncbi:DUF6927 domain-containing protein [Glutamicibacter ardleyensis]|uniref:DUF6927 domain-containing protein n=1 Tax=Glutamicibacter ardleyensis TaxID=225894 RepID=UPI003FD090CE